MKDQTIQNFPDDLMSRSRRKFLKSLLGKAAALNTLYEDHFVGCAVIGDNIRYSPHIYNTLEDIDRGVMAIKRMLI